VVVEAEKGDEASYQYLSINYYYCRLLVEDGRMVVVEAEKGDEGNYQCLATNEAGTRTSHRASLSVYGKKTEYLCKAMAV
jgi:hypothetical protein